MKNTFHFRPQLPNPWIVELGWSFPSGHAASTLSVALGLAGGLPPAAGPLLGLVAITVGASRCYLGVHYPGDVVAGWSLALAGLAGAALVLG